MGLVNLSVNPHYRSKISQQLELILPLLQSHDTETLISALTLLYYLQLVVADNFRSDCNWAFSDIPIPAHHCFFLAHKHPFKT